MVFPSSLAGCGRLKVSGEVLRKEGGTSGCHILTGMCIQPTGTNPRPRISTVKPTSQNLGLVLSCRKHAQNSAVKESIAVQNKPKKLGRPKSRAASHHLTRNNNKRISSKPRILGPQPRAGTKFSIQRSQRPSFHDDCPLLPTSVSASSRGDASILALSSNTRSRPPGLGELSCEVLRDCGWPQIERGDRLPLDLSVPERPGQGTLPAEDEVGGGCVFRCNTAGPPPTPPLADIDGYPHPLE